MYVHLPISSLWHLTGIMKLWQMAFIAGVVGWTMVRDWPWTHTVFFVLHGIVMLMKQHSYASYNGYLSGIYKRRQMILTKLEELELLESGSRSSPSKPHASSASTAQTPVTLAAGKTKRPVDLDYKAQKIDIEMVSELITSQDPHDREQTRVLARAIQWEADDLEDTLKGTASDASKAYPANLGFIDHYKWIPLPTVVYEFEYPRSRTISWPYVAEKFVAMVGVIFVMIQVSQYAICKCY